MSTPLEWPEGRPRVLITDCWLTNAGDAAIALGTQRLVAELAPGAAILHAAYGRSEVGHLYPELSLVPPVDQLVGTTWAPRSTTGGVDDAFLRSADLVVSQGGGFLRQEYRPWSRVEALFAIVERDLPLLLLGQTIGAFDLAFIRRNLGHVLRSARGVVVRDLPSLTNVRDLGATSPNVRLGGDLAVALVEPTVVEANRPVSVVLSGASVPGRDRDQTANALLQAVLERAPTARVRVWSSAQAAGDEGDHHTAMAAVSRLSPEDRARVDLILDHVPARHLLELAADSSAMVSMRLHPALLAAAQGTPTVLVLDDQKAGAIAGTAIAHRTVRGVGQPAADAAAALLIEGEARWSEADALLPLRDALDVSRKVLAQVLDQVIR